MGRKKFLPFFMAVFLACLGRGTYIFISMMKVRILEEHIANN